jgi:hypothetical protein
MAMLRKSLFLFLPVILLFSCTGNEYKVLKVLTDQKDMILVSEYYNLSQDKNRISLVYNDYISLGDIKETVPDIVIGKNLNNSLFYDQFLPIIPPEGIYPVLIRNNQEGVPLLPVSFDVPVLIYDRSIKDIPLVLDWQTLKEKTESLNIISESQYKHMGFSPLWSDEFLYWFLQGEGVTFYEGGVFDYDPDLLSQKLELISQWVNENNGSLAAHEAFSRKYRYIPDYKLMKSGYIDFTAMSFSQFTALPEAETVGLTHSWYGNGEFILPQDMVYGGVRIKTDLEEEGKEFLLWLISVDVQKELLKRKGNVTPGFALFDGFSSLEEINREVLPGNFPKNLSDRIFLPEQLGSPVMEPENWSAIKESVIYPWLHETVRKNISLPLSSYFNEWQLLFLD